MAEPKLGEMRYMAGGYVVAKKMDEKTRSAILNKDANRMELPVYPGASSNPRAKLPEREIEAQRVVDPDLEAAKRAIAEVKMEREEAKAKAIDADAIRQRLFDQVAGK